MNWDDHRYFLAIARALPDRRGKSAGGYTKG